MSVMVAEDDLVTARMLESVLENHGYHVVMAHTGEEALQGLGENPEVQLVIADIMMPGLDGLELVDQIRQRPEWRCIPIIMCTSLADLQTVRRAASAGCKHYLLKPIRAVQLMQKIHEILDDEKPILRSRRRVMFQANLDYKAYDEIADAFATQLRAMIVHLENDLREERLGQVRESIFVLVDGAVLLGAERVAEALRKLAVSCAAGPNEESRSACWVLLREMKALDRALTAQLLATGSSSPQE